jgi:hypothetical protein
LTTLISISSTINATLPFSSIIFFGLLLNPFP